MNVELLRAVLGWGAVFNFAFLTFMFFVFLAGRRLIYRLHGRWFGLPEGTINAVLYGALAWYKLANFLFFVMPYIALRISA